MQSPLTSMNTHRNGRMMTRLRKSQLIVVLLLLSLVTAYFLTELDYLSSAAEIVKSAERLVVEKHSDEAERQLRWLLWFDPSNSDARLVLGLSLQQQGKFDEAIESLELIPKGTTSFNDARIILGTCLVQAGYFDQAEVVLLELLDFPLSEGQVGIVLEKLRSLFVTQFRHDDLMEICVEQLTANGRLLVLPMLMQIETMPKGPQGWIRELEVIDRKIPNQRSVVLALARGYSRVGQVEKARAHFERAIQNWGDDPAVRIGFAEFLGELGEPDVRPLLSGDRNASASKALRARAWAVMARIQEAQGDLLSSLHDIDQSLTLQPNVSESLSRRLGLLRQLGRSEDAAEVAAKMVELETARQRLLLLFDQMNLSHPSVDDCNEAAEIYNLLEKVDQSKGWRLTAKEIRSGTRQQP